MKASDVVKEARLNAHVVGTPERFSIVPPESQAANSRQVAFRVFIQGVGSDESAGFNLCYEAVSEGFAADDWYPTLTGAEEAAFALFGITEQDWVHAI